MQQACWTRVGKLYVIDVCIPVFRESTGNWDPGIFNECFDSFRLALCTSDSTVDEDVALLDELVECNAPGYPPGGWPAKIAPTSTAICWSPERDVYCVRDYRDIEFCSVTWVRPKDADGIDIGDIHWLALVDQGRCVHLCWPLPPLSEEQRLEAATIEFKDLALKLEFLPCN